MKKISTIIMGVLVVGLSNNTAAQSIGTLTFSFTQVTHSPCYSGSRNVLAAWIETSSGTFVKTKLRYCCGGSTTDHLPTWTSKASGGTTTNAGSSACNKTDATTGATLTSFGAKSFTWDGKNVNGTSNGTTVADGAYRVAIQETWNHGSSSTVVRYFNFTKGTAADHQTPATDANFSNITLDWVPSGGVGIDEESENPSINIYPNPSTGIFNVDLLNVQTIKVFNTLGAMVYEEKVDISKTTSSIDLTDFANGIYFVAVINDKGTTYKKVMLNK